MQALKTGHTNESILTSVMTQMQPYVLGF